MRAWAGICLLLLWGSKLCLVVETWFKWSCASTLQLLTPCPHQHFLPRAPENLNTHNPGKGSNVSAPQYFNTCTYTHTHVHPNIHTLTHPILFICHTRFPSCWHSSRAPQFYHMAIFTYQSRIHTASSIGDIISCVTNELAFACAFMPILLLPIIDFRICVCKLTYGKSYSLILLCIPRTLKVSMFVQYRRIRFCAP